MIPAILTVALFAALIYMIAEDTDSYAMKAVSIILVLIMIVLSIITIRAVLLML